ncbi:uncharacterized protein [Haliotis cracherodii]|uniref:uncharacterized protein n=1 Tax=Haliotis cracherodii TaxID=6455 RepID=UPI0039E75C2D
MVDTAPVLVLCVLALLNSTAESNNATEKIMFITDSGGSLEVNGSVFRCVLDAGAGCTVLPIYTPNPRCPVYDHVEDYVYWSDYALQSVCRVKSSGEDYETWVNVSRGLYGMALDSQLRTIFVFELSQNGSSSLWKVTMDTQILTKVPIEKSSVWGIATDTQNKKLFLAFASKITMMNYDGTEYVTLLNKKTGDHFGMMFDKEGHRLYYADTGARTLGSLDVETKETTVYSNDTVYLSVHQFEGVLYAGPFGDRGRVDEIPGGCGPRSYVYFNTSVVGGIRATVFRKYGCSSGWYGRMCNRECGKCFNGSTCDNVAGYCPAGCDTGWIGDTCTTVCPKGTYGESCRNLCDQCADGAPCHPGNLENWNEEVCHEDRGYVVWALVAVCVFLGLVVVVLLVLLVRWRRMMMTDKQKKTDVTVGAVRNPTYQDDTRDAEAEITNHVYEKMVRVLPPVYETIHV